MRSSVVRKAVMAASGLFLVAFLVVHMLGNLQLFLPEPMARRSFNAYSQTLTSSVLIQIAGLFTYAAVAGHVVVSALLVRRNRRSRGRGYAMERAEHSSPWYARSMGWLGAITLAFLVQHMMSFWYRYHWGPIGDDAHGRKDLYEVVVTAFAEPWIVVFYVISMVALGYHLQHGIAASMRSLGIFSARLDKLAQPASVWIAWSITGPFIAMPVYVYAFVAGGS